MIPIKIADKKYSIKSIDELTTKEFMELSKIDKLDIQKYIIWQTGLDEKTVFFSSISRTVEKAIGKSPNITKMKPCMKYDLSKGIESIGQRHQVEDSGKEGLELLIFSLAVAQANSMNINDVMVLYNQYLDEPFKEVLPTGFFFFMNYRFGRNSVVNIFAKRLGLIRTLRLKNKLGLKG